jgi:hypothetical protein
LRILFLLLAYQLPFIDLIIEPAAAADRGREAGFICLHYLRNKALAVLPKDPPTTVELPILRRRLEFLVLIRWLP